MNAEFKKELKALAERHNIEITFNCAYCGHSKEALAFDALDRSSHFVTLTPLPKKNKR